MQDLGIPDHAPLLSSITTVQTVIVSLLSISCIECLSDAQALQDLFKDHGDRIARQYAGSGAMHKEALQGDDTEVRPQVAVFQLRKCSV